MLNQPFESSQPGSTLQFQSKVEKRNNIFVIFSILFFCLAAFFIYQNLQLRNRLLSQSTSSIENVEQTPSASATGSLEPNIIAQEPRSSTSMYPAAKDGFTKYYIWLPTLTNESDNQVEIVVGKNTMVDCNSAWYSGVLEEKSVQGWGYTYYEVNNVAGPMSTRMGCSESSDKEAFIQVIGDNYLVRYNSKLPVVVYVPNDFEVQYKVWTTNSSLFEAEKQ